MTTNFHATHLAQGVPLPPCPTSVVPNPDVEHHIATACVFALEFFLATLFAVTTHLRFVHADDKLA